MKKYIQKIFGIIMILVLFVCNSFALADIVVYKEGINSKFGMYEVTMRSWI